MLSTFQDTFEAMQDFSGHVFIPRQAPESSGGGFFKTFFGGGLKTVDRDDLCKSRQVLHRIRGLVVCVM